MNGRDRILEALQGGAADRVPLALGFFQLDGAALAPAGEWRDDLVDVAFVRFPVSPEEEVLRRWAAPFDGDTRIGSITQAARYASWRYHPERRDGNPLEAAETLEDLERFPFPDVSGAYLAAGLAHQVDVIHALGLAAAGNPPHLGGSCSRPRAPALEPFMLDLVDRRDIAHFMLTASQRWRAGTPPRSPGPAST
jgi:hypothetical protein